MTHKFKRYVNPPFKQVSYVLYNSNKECLLVDIGGHASEIIDFIKRNDLVPLAFLFTHAHCDHVAGVTKVWDEFQIPLYMHEGDTKILEQASFYWHFIAPKILFFGPSLDQMSIFPSNTLLLGDFSIDIMHVPGHTPGSCFLKTGNIIFTGDTLLKDTIGRTDLVGGNRKDLLTSLQSLPKFSEDDILLPGHGEPFTPSELDEFNFDYQNCRSK